MIRETNIRTLLTIDKQLKSTLENMAKEESRSFNNLVNLILKKYVEDHKK